MRHQFVFIVTLSIIDGIFRLRLIRRLFDYLELPNCLSSFFKHSDKRNFLIASSDSQNSRKARLRQTLSNGPDLQNFHILRNIKQRLITVRIIVILFFFVA